MKVSREQVAEHRARILEAAGRLFRARGFAGVTVAEVMQEAGLTHGAFYGHFKSKDDLIAQTLAHLLAGGTAAPAHLAAFAASYLTPEHCANRGGGCVVAGLGAETIRQSPEAQAAMTAGLRAQIERLTNAAPGSTRAEKHRAAIGSWAAMVGALTLARMSNDPRLAEEVLAQTRRWIDAKATRAVRARRAS